VELNIHGQWKKELRDSGREAVAVGLWEAEPVSGLSLVRVSFTLFRVFLSTSGAGEDGRSPVAVQWCSGGAEFAAELDVGGC
jgi:hypothetical protein